MVANAICWVLINLKVQSQEVSTYYVCVSIFTDSIKNINWAPVLCQALFWPLDHCCSVTKLCSTLCDPMDCNTPGFHVLHYLSEFAQIIVH